ncbi:monocarboxylate transporter 9-like [Archocentrus centrarchus]|uniref:monocarboxylate transporter 9-like n=1 Tax=Archocentrus centrarchus TaxID=63155 RepID=UPI0011EA3D2D|nr:monocarboxylate transporter 9-like [Archocentrus centrarchus]
MSSPGSGPSGARPLALDGGWGWVIVVSGFLALLLGYGSPQSVGILYPEWLVTFGEGKAMTAWVGSVVTGIGLIVGPICSVCVVNFGARPVTIFSSVMVAGGLMLSAFAPNISFLIFSYGVVVGVGVGLLYAATLTITCLYFDKRRGLALGIVTTGSSAGGFLYATLQGEFVDLFGLDGCLLLVGALALNIIACAGPMRPLTPPKYYLKQRAAILEQHLREEQELTNEKLLTKDQVMIMETTESQVRRCSLLSCSAFIERMKMKMKRHTRSSSSLSSVLQDRVFLALCVSLFFFSFGSSPPALFLEDLAQSARLTEGVPPISLVSLLSIGSGVGKLTLGVMADVPRVDSVVLYALTVAVSGLGVILIPLTRSYLGLQVLSVSLGFMAGNWTLTPYVTGQVVGLEKLADAHGILMFFGGIGIVLGSPVVGKKD